MALLDGMAETAGPKRRPRNGQRRSPSRLRRIDQAQGRQMGNVEGARTPVAVRTPPGTGLGDVAECIRTEIAVGLRVGGRSDTQRVQHDDDRAAHLRPNPGPGAKCGSDSSGVFMSAVLRCPCRCVRGTHKKAMPRSLRRGMVLHQCRGV